MNKSNLTKAAMLVTILFVLACLVAFFSAAETGNLSGYIKNKSTGAPMQNVKVTMTASGMSVRTDTTGFFIFENISVGSYDLVISTEKFQSVKVEGIDITAFMDHHLQIFLKEDIWKTAAVKTIPAQELNIQVERIKDDKLALGAADSFEEELTAPKDMSLQSKKAAAAAAAKARAGTGIMAVAGAAGGAGSSGQSASVILGGAASAGGAYLNPPNGQKYWDMYHHDYGTNPFIDTEDDDLSTFGADVSTASYSLVRNYIMNGELPPKDAVRVEEFVNYFNPSYSVPENKTFNVSIQSAPSVISKNYQLVRIGIKGKEIKEKERKPANLTFVIDVSGSMNIENRLGLVKKTLLLLIRELKSDDRVGIVTYGTEAQTVLEPTSDKETIADAVNNLYSDGSTNAEAGLRQGYQLAAKNFLPQSINRVILCTDGVANNGETSSEGLLQLIEKYKNKGITLSACGFGMGNYNDVLIEQLATKGDGTYYYIDDLNEAKRVFVEQLTGTLQVIAKDVKIQVTFDKDRVSRYRLIGYEKRDVKDEDFRNDKIDGGEIGSGHTVTALYEVKFKDPSIREIGKISIRYKSPDGKDVTEIEEALGMNTPACMHETATIQFMSAVALYSEIMRESYWAKKRELSEVKSILNNIDNGFRSNYSQFEDFYDLVNHTMKLKSAKILGENRQGQ